jgi:mannose/cellobiose epimerase-like protein (N-acyl-D-glucosamine 2-epimerase family)
VTNWSFLIDLILQENDPTLKGRVHQSDAREMQRFYREYYKKYIQALQNAADKTDRSAACLLPSFALLLYSCYAQTAAVSTTLSD